MATIDVPIGFCKTIRNPSAGVANDVVFTAGYDFVRIWRGIFRADLTGAMSPAEIASISSIVIGLNLLIAADDGLGDSTFLNNIYLLDPAIAEDMVETTCRGDSYDTGHPWPTPWADTTGNPVTDNPGLAITDITQRIGSNLTTTGLHLIDTSLWDVTINDIAPNGILGFVMVHRNELGTGFSQSPMFASDDAVDPTKRPFLRVTYTAQVLTGRARGRQRGRGRIPI